jgi:hypothetical protein
VNAEERAATRALAEAQADAYAQMLTIGEGVGGLGIQFPEMFQDMLSWGDATDNEHADTVLALLDAIDRVLTLHRPERLGGEDVCTSCLRYTSPLPGRVAWPCATVRAIEGVS